MGTTAKKRILLIDDDRSFLKVLGFSLEKEGFDVCRCASGEAALNLLQSQGFAVIISDFKMGEVSGLAVVQAAKKMKPPIPTILLTAYAGSLSYGSFGPDRVFAKPIEMETLVAAIENLDSSASQPHEREFAMKVKDPVCGMSIDVKSAIGNIQHKGMMFYFCSQACLDKFRTDPQKFSRQQESQS